MQLKNISQDKVLAPRWREFVIRAMMTKIIKRLPGTAPVANRRQQGGAVLL